MGRIFFFVILGVAIWVAWSISRRNSQLSNEEREELSRLREKEGLKKRSHAMEAMVQCAHCGVYFPRQDGVRRGEHLYCSARCRDKGPKLS